MHLQKPNLNGEYSVYKLRQNSNKCGDYLVADEQFSNDVPDIAHGPGSNDPVANSAQYPNSQCSHDLLGSTDATPSLPNKAPNQQQWQAPETCVHSSLKGDSLRSTTDSDILSDELSPPAKHKVVAIDTTRNKQFSRRLLPVQSPEFDNVIDQVLSSVLYPYL